MKEVTLDIKTMITIGGIIALMGGFYYNTIYRLDSLEAKVESVSKKVDYNKSAIKNIRKNNKKGSK
jgi:hypothetical protein|tara:strand:+ start:448 stop:645 length:198 start_codon:yes stop_codon:yes gene_type:complete